MRIINPEYAYFLSDPEKNYAPEFFPEFLPVVYFKVQRNYIFVLLGRILCILYRPIRTSSEPVLMLFHIWMIGTDLKCNVQGNLDPVVLCSLHEPLKILHGSKSWMHRHVPSFL